MGLFDRIFNDGRGTPAQAGQTSQPQNDEQAIARYRYLVRTAPPEAIEQAHAEAFARLTPEQRRRVLSELQAELPSTERASVARAGDDPNALARVATRAELRQPGALERAFNRAGTPGGMGFGGMLAGSFLGSMAGMVLGSAIAHQFFDQHQTTDGMASGGTTADNPIDAADSGSVDSGGFDSGFDGGGFDV